MNATLYDAWARSWRRLRPWLHPRDKRLVLTGYSTGVAAATLSALVVPVDRLYLFSPFPFSDARLYDTLRVAYVAVWIRGDLLTRCFAPLFSPPRHHHILASPRCYLTVFGYHSTREIVRVLQRDRGRADAELECMRCPE